MNFEAGKAKLLFLLFGFLTAVLLTSCYQVEETDTESGGGSSGNEVCFRDCPYDGGWGAFLTPSCWETVPCGSSAASLSWGEEAASISMDPVVMLLGDASPEGNVSLEFGGVFVSVPDALTTVVLSNRTTGVSWLADAAWTGNGYEWSSIVPLDGYAAIYGANRFLVELYGDRFVESAETTVEVGYW